MLYDQIVEKGHPSRAEYKAWLAEDSTRKMLSKFGPKASGHTSSPLVFLGETYVGGHDDSVAYVAKASATKTEEISVVKKTVTPPAVPATIAIDPKRVEELKAAPSEGGGDEDEACFT